MKQDKQKEQQKREVELHYTRELYTNSYIDFFIDAVKVLEQHTNFEINFHHVYLAQLLQDEFYRIHKHQPRKHHYNVNISPRSSKSFLFSVVYPVWCWTINPHIDFMYVCHTENLSLRLANKSKQLIETEWFKELYPNFAIRPDVSAKSYYQTVEGGIRMSFGIGGALTGEGASIIILDDILKPQEISNEKLIQSIDIYKETITTRLNNQRESVIINVSQRLAENDLSGFLKSSNDDSFFHVVLPAELTDDVSPVELREKYIDGLFWPSRMGWDVLSSLQSPTSIGKKGYQAQFLQNPIPAEGGLIKTEWFDIIDNAPEGIQYHLFCDLAETSNKKNDPSAIIVCGVKDNTMYVKKVYEVWLEFTDVIKYIEDVVKKDGNVNTLVYIEPKSSGKAVIQSLRKNSTLNIVELEATKESKVKRVTAITPKLQSKRVKLVRDFWNDNFLYQCSTFPLGKHDDMVDVCTYGTATLLTNTDNLRWYM